MADFKILKTIKADQRFPNLQFFSMFETAVHKLYNNIAKNHTAVIVKLVANILAPVEIVNHEWRI